MLDLANRLARLESEADRREFLAGVTGIDGVSIKSLAAGVVSMALLLKGK
jgi:hypothetical protein